MFLLKKLFNNTARGAGRIVTAPVRNVAELTEGLSSLGGASRHNRFGNTNKPGKARDFQIAHPEERTWMAFEEGVGPVRKALGYVPTHLTNVLNGIENIVHPRVTKVYNSGWGHWGEFLKNLAKDAVVTTVPAVGLNVLAPETGTVMDVRYDPDDPTKTLKDIPTDWDTIKGITQRDEDGNPIKTIDGRTIVYRPNGVLKPSRFPRLAKVTSLFNKINNNPRLNFGYAQTRRLFNNQFHPYNSLYGASHTATAYADHIKNRLRSLPTSVEAGELNNLLMDKKRLASYLMRDAKTKSLWFPNAEYLGASAAKDAVRTELENKLGEMMDSPDFDQLRTKIISNKENGLIETDIARNVINNFLDNKFYDIDNEIRKGVYENLKKPDSRTKYWSTSPVYMDAYIRKGIKDGHDFYTESTKEQSEE